MVGPSEASQSTFDLLSRFEAPSWGLPGDLSRLSLAAFVSRDAPLELGSSGAIRLTGGAVAGNSARLDVVGAVCTEFQRLVVAVGASLEGVKSARGKISETLQQRARLSLRATPAPGSIILGLVPELEATGRPGDARPPEDLFGRPEPLADKAVDAIISTLRLAKADDVVNDSLAEVLGAWGPRAASALSSWSSVLGSDSVDIDFSWDAPHVARQAVSFSSADARRLKSFVAGRRLDETVIPLDGQLRTVSDRRSLEIQVGEEIFPVNRGEVSPAHLGTFRVGDLVRAEVTEKVEYKVGGGEARSYTLLLLSPSR